MMALAVSVAPGKQKSKTALPRPTPAATTVEKAT